MKRTMLGCAAALALLAAAAPALAATLTGPTRLHDRVHVRAGGDTGHAVASRSERIG